jgi:uncharacterized membrane protein
MSATGPVTAEFAYVQAANSIAARIMTGRPMHRSQRVRLYVDFTTCATRFRNRPAEAISLSQPDLTTVSSSCTEEPRGTYAEEPLRYGDTPEPTSEKPDDDSRSSGERVRQHDSGSFPATALAASQTSASELLHGSTESPVRGNDGSDPGSSQPSVGSQVIREVVREEIQAYWSAPLPSPESLEHYDKIVPGMAERILSMTERLVTGKINLDDKVASSEIENARRSINVAFGLTLMAFAASVVFFAVDNRVAGLAFLSFPVAMLIRAFLLRSERSESAELQ